MKEIKCPIHNTEMKISSRSIIDENTNPFIGNKRIGGSNHQHSYRIDNEYISVWEFKYTCPFGCVFSYTEKESIISQTENWVKL